MDKAERLVAEARKDRGYLYPEWTYVAILGALEAAAIPGGAPTFVTGVRVLVKVLEEK
jgi:hypothetical protein